MKKYYLLLVISLTLLIFCKSVDPNYKQYNREIRYFQSNIHNIDKDIITLSDGTEWKTRRFVVSVNMTKVFFIINSFGYGDVYINGQKHQVEFNDKDMDGGVRYFIGYKNEIKNINKELIELLDGSRWEVQNSDQIDLQRWQTASEIIINDDENVMTNPFLIESITVKLKDSNLKKNN